MREKQITSFVEPILVQRHFWSNCRRVCAGEPLQVQRQRLASEQIRVAFVCVCVIGFVFSFCLTSVIGFLFFYSWALLCRGLSKKQSLNCWHVCIWESRASSLVPDYLLGLALQVKQHMRLQFHTHTHIYIFSLWRWNCCFFLVVLSVLVKNFALAPTTSPAGDFPKLVLWINKQRRL